MQHSIASFKLGASHFFFSIFTLCVCAFLSSIHTLMLCIHVLFSSLSLSLSFMSFQLCKAIIVSWKYLALVNRLRLFRRMYSMLENSTVNWVRISKHCIIRSSDWTIDNYILKMNNIPSLQSQVHHCKLVWFRFFFCVVDVVVVASIHCCILWKILDLPVENGKN